jgi:hypothetical protein
MCSHKKPPAAPAASPIPTLPGPWAVDPLVDLYLGLIACRERLEFATVYSADLAALPSFKRTLAETEAAIDRHTSRVQSIIAPVPGVDAAAPSSAPSSEPALPDYVEEAIRVFGNVMYENGTYDPNAPSGTDARAALVAALRRALREAQGVSR